MKLFVQQAGGDLLDLNNEKTREALQFIYDLVHKYKIVSPDCVTTTYELEWPNYVNNMYAMSIAWDDVIPIYQGYKDWYSNDKVTFVPMFKGPENDLTEKSTNGYVIPKNAKNKELAQEFIKFMTSKDAQIQLGSERPPSRLSAYDDINKFADQTIAKTRALYVNNGTAMFFAAGKQSEIEMILDPDFNAALAGQITLDQAITRTQQKVDEILKAK